VAAKVIAATAVAIATLRKRFIFLSFFLFFWFVERLAECETLSKGSAYEVPNRETADPRTSPISTRTVVGGVLTGDLVKDPQRGHLPGFNWGNLPLVAHAFPYKTRAF
jgi:hypothetical protein